MALWNRVGRFGEKMPLHHGSCPFSPSLRSACGLVARHGFARVCVLYKGIIEESV